ncbi:MAG: ATP-binding cassette domain-containing protein [Ignisphaera sp.]
MPLVEVRGLTKVYEAGFIRKRRIVAVDNVSFDIREGEIVSLVGESGSGKTTTAKILLRLLPPTSGVVKFQGKDIWREINSKDELRDYWKKVHAVFQDPYASYNSFYTVDRVLNQALNLIGIDPRSNEGKKLVREALSYVGLVPDDVLGKYPHQLSGGQRQRLMIARCWLLKPKLILADEPVSMIDASMRGAIIKLFMNLRDDYGTSTVFITHDMGLAYYVSDRILVMYKGKIVDEGPPDEIVKSPKHEYTKLLLSSVPTLYRKWKWE